MKYLHNHPRTSNIWKPQRLLINAWFFFDDRGSYIQKSLEGLLHAILYRVTSSDKRLADTILPMYAEKRPDQRDTWPISELQQALILLLNQEELGLDLHLFLDALDEYGDPPEVIADFVADMSDRQTNFTKVKVCFSSRPWNVFLDRFGHCPGFSIHDHTKNDIRRFTRSIFIENELMTGSQISSENVDVMNLLSEIVRRAQGVFLWAKLVSTDLIRAYHEGASFAELRQLVSKFPEKLEDYYARIIDRLPQSRRFETFAMLEVVLRTNTSLSVEDFTGAIQCAPCETSNECAVNAAFKPCSPAALEKTTRYIRDCTGGLLEIIVITSGSVVEFMHQTVKHFISRPGFMRRLLGPEASEIRENGHSFLAKYYIAKTIASSHVHDDYVLSNASLGMLHAHLSETTTGMSQRIFLDSLEDDSVAQGFQKLLVVNSPMSLAVVADLRLYVRERLEELNTVNENASLSLLYCLTRFTVMRWNTLGRRPREVLKDLNPTEMCQMLLDFGADLGTRSESLTPFQALLAPDVELGAEGFPSSSQSRTVARVLMEQGQNPEEELNFGIRRLGWPRCRAIHISDADMSKLLLEYGADVNALDGIGRTPLDIALSPNLETLEFGNRPERVHDRISVLLDHGACITKNAEKHLGRCLDWLNEYNLSISQLDRFLVRLERGSPPASPEKRQSASLEQPKLVRSHPNPALVLTAGQSASSRLSQKDTKLPKRPLRIWPRWTSTTIAGPDRGEGDGIRRQPTSRSNRQVDEPKEIQ
jgi:hypothetical protein